MANTVYVNVSGTWKESTAYYVNVSGTWKTGTEFQARISSTWKGGTSTGPVGLPSISSLLGLDISDFILPTIGTLDAKAAINSKTLDISDFVLPVVGRDF